MKSIQIMLRNINKKFVSSTMAKLGHSNIRKTQITYTGLLFTWVKERRIEKIISLLYLIFSTIQILDSLYINKQKTKTFFIILGKYYKLWQRYELSSVFGEQGNLLVENTKLIYLPRSLDILSRFYLIASNLNILILQKRNENWEVCWIAEGHTVTGQLILVIWPNLRPINHIKLL